MGFSHIGGGLCIFIATKGIKFLLSGTVVEKSHNVVACLDSGLKTVGTVPNVVGIAANKPVGAVEGEIEGANVSVVTTGIAAQSEAQTVDGGVVYPRRYAVAIVLTEVGQQLQLVAPRTGFAEKRHARLVGGKGHERSLCLGGGGGKVVEGGTNIIHISHRHYVVTNAQSEVGRKGLLHPEFGEFQFVPTLSLSAL